MTSRSSKGILKKTLDKSPGVGTPSVSWLSRIHSKLSASSNDYAASTLTRRDLKRVTFSVSHLATEYMLLGLDDDGQDAPSMDTPKSQKEEPDNDLPFVYERACRLREEPVLDRFLDILYACRFTTLTSVDLSGCPISRHQGGPIADIFMVDCGMRRLRLANCGLDNETLRVMLHSLLVRDKVEELDLSCNPFATEGFRYISIYVSESRAIQNLDLSQCLPDTHALKYLARAISAGSSLHSLTMDRCSLKPPLLEILAGGVRQSRCLSFLSVKHNGINRNAAPWIAATLLKDEPIEVHWQISGYPRHGLQQLNLTGNNLQHAMAALAQALCSNRSLTHLLLTNCQIYPEECVLLMNALLVNHRLQMLDLSQNPIACGSDEGIQSIKHTLSKNHFLQELSLADTDLDASAAIALAECLAENSTLCRLDLSNNPHVNLAGVLALSISIKMNTTLTFLDINIPPNDAVFASLQNDIVAVCTRNMQRAYELSENIQCSSAPQETPPSSEASLSSSPAASSASQSVIDIDTYPETSVESILDYSSGRHEHDSLGVSIPTSFAFGDMSLVNDLL